MINCTLSNKQLRILRTKIAKDLLTYVDNKDNFDLKDYLSKIYDQVNTATQNQNLALDYARVSVPFIKQLLGVDTTLEDLPEQGLDLAALYATAKSFANEKTGFDEVVKYLNVTVNTAKKLADIKADLEKDEQQQQAKEKNIRNKAVSTIYKETRKPYNPVSTTIQELLKGEKNAPRDPRMKIYTTVTKAILKAGLKEGMFIETPLDGVEYPGVKGGIFIKMMRYNEVAVNDTYPHVKEILESGVEKDYVIEDYNNAFVYVITDKEGNPIRFNSDAEVKPDGKLIYYSARYLPNKTSDGKFDVDNVTNTQTPIEVAKNLGISVDEAREYLREGFTELEKAYNYIREKKGNSIIYAIDGGSLGALEDRNPKMVPFNERIFENEPIEFAFFKKENLRPGQFAGIYATGALSKYSILIAPNNISEQLATDLATMLTKQVDKKDGTPLGNSEKYKILSTYILNSIKDIKYTFDKSTGTIEIKLEGEDINLGSKEAFDTLKNAFLKLPNGYNRSVAVALPLANGNKNVTVFSSNPNGTYNVETVPYSTYMSENTKMNVDLDEDGKIKRYNPYFTLVIQPDNMDKLLLDPKNVEQREESNNEKVARLRAEEQEELRKAIPNIDSYKVKGKIDSDLMPEDIRKVYQEIYNKYDAVITPILMDQIEIEIMEALSKVQDEAAFTGARELTPEEQAEQDRIIAEITKKYLGSPKKMGKPGQTTTENKPEEFVNHSGGAYGGDTFWDIIGRQFGVKEHRHYKEKGGKVSQTLANIGVQTTPLTEEQMKFAEEQINTLFGEEFLKKWTKKEEKDLQIRNYYQVANADAVFAVAELNKDGNGVKGGTNTAVQLGIKLNKPTYVWDLKTNSWYAYEVAEEDKDGVSYKLFVPSDTPTLTKNFAGVGSRDIEIYSVPLKRDASGKVTKWGTTLDTKKYRGKATAEAAKNAIREVYEKTFGKSEKEVDPFVKADATTPIEQNFKDGSDGRKMQPQFAGKSTMDLIISGNRTRTTRGTTDIRRMLKDYNLVDIFDLEGRIVRMTDNTGRQVYTKITKVEPFTQEYQDATWQKEGWEKSVTDKHVGEYPYAIEFEVVNRPGQQQAANLPGADTKINKSGVVSEGLITNSSGFVEGPVMKGFTKVSTVTGAEIYDGQVFNQTEADAIENTLNKQFPIELAKPEQAAGNKWALKSIYYGPIDYSYGSGKARLVRPAKQMPKWLEKVVRETEKRMGVAPGYFDTALINKYTDTNTKIGMHTDAEENLIGKDKSTNPTVLTISFGANRFFKLEGIKDFKGNDVKIETKHGNVLVMGRDSQFNYLHGIEQSTGEDGVRYSITLRHTPDVNPVRGNELVKTTPVQQAAQQTVKKVEEQQIFRRGRSSADSNILDQLMNDDDFIDKNGKNKLGVQGNIKATREQIALALKWYENSPLRQHIPFKVMFNAINTATKNGIARWDVNGITLFKGSDYSDLYHEAWHGFTQTFLTKEERDKLYSETGKNKGSFVTFSGDTVTFAEATEEELEEYLAEDFREYMLSKGNKVLDKTPVKKTIFQKIFEFLKALFGKTSADDIITNGNNNSYVNELYEKLRVGDLNQYTFNQANRVFTTLNKVVTTTTPKDSTTPSKLGYEASRLIGSTVDSLFSEAIDKLNGSRTKIFTTAAIRTVKGRSTVYKYVLQELTKQLENVYLDKLDMEAKGLDTQDIDFELDILCYAVKHFGNPDNLSNPTGVIKYHMETSKFMEFDDRQIAELNEIDDSKLTIKNEFESKSGNELSAKSLASPTLLYTIRSLYAYDKNGDVRTNRLGFPMLMDYNAAWNRIYNITDGARNIQEVYDRLSAASVDYPAIKQFLAKIGSPSNMETSSQNLWTEITHVLTMKRIPLMALRTTHTSTMEERIDPDTGEVAIDEFGKVIKDTVTAVKITPTRAGGEYSKVGAKWDNYFAVAAPSKYISVGADNVNTMNIAQIMKDFYALLSKDNLDKVFGFMEAVGMPLEDNATVRKALLDKNNPTFKAIYDLHTTIRYGILPYNNEYAGSKPIVIKKPSELFKDFGINSPDSKINNKLSGISIKYNTIQNFHLIWSDDFSDTTVTNAEGENQYEKSLRGTLMNQVDAINSADSLADLTQEGVENAEDLSMNHLAKSRNPFMKTSKFMSRLFNSKGEKIVYESSYGDVVRSQIELLNMSGSSVEVTNVRGIINESGIASANADETTKTLQDFYMMMLYGVSEGTRHADKSTTYLYRLIAANSKGKLYKHLIELESFTKRSTDDAPSEGRIEFTKDLIKHLCAEYERIQKLKDGDVAGTAIVGDKTYAEVGSNFVIFDKILDEPTKNKIKKARNSSLAEPVITAEDLFKYLNDPKRVSLKNSIEQQIGNYLSSQIKEFETSLTEMGFYNNPILADQVLTKMGVRSPQNVTAERRAQLLKDMAEAYVANSWLQNLETVLIFYGDPALYPGEADFFKRNAGIGATGGIPRTDIYMQEYINNKLAANSLASKLPGGLKPKKFGRTMTSAVMEDAKTQSVYYDEYLKEAIEFETDRLTKLKASKEQIDKTIQAITKRFGEYKKMTEGDGQGWINFDAYRALLMSLNKWTSTQESIYNKIVNGEEVTENVLQFFPVKKMQYWGPLKTDGLPVIGFHKFSLMPLIPNIIKGKNLEKLQTKMLEQGIDYALLKSGSKINTLTKDGKVDKFYNESKNNKNKTLAIEAEGFEFTPNEIFMDYFKDQLEVHDHFNGKVTFSTQLRKLIEDGLMENGVPTDWKPFEFTSAYDRIQAWEEASPEEKATSRNYKKLIRYEANLKALVQLKKDKLKKEIGSDMKSLLDFVKKELTRQELSDHEIDFVDYDGITKEPKQSLDLSLSADKIEKLLVAVIQKRLINQKINGESLVQVSGVGFENANTDMRNATEEEMEKYGTNGLTFYRKKADGSTAAMKIKVAIQGGFKKLLYHPDVLALAKTGITPIEALNRLIKDENWLDKPINPNQEIYSKAFAKLDSAKGDSKLFILRSELTPELLNELTPDTKDGKRVKGGEYHGIKILGDYYSHNTVKSKDGENLDIIIVDKVEDAEAQYQAYLAGGAKNFTGISEIEPVDKNRSFITMVAARIPVQGLNSMEFMEVYEFLPEEAGNIVILPAEIVAKSGGDFDIDKMFTMMPNISVKYKKISDKSIQAISDEFGRKVTREEIEELEEKYADLDNEEPFTEEEVMILDLVDNLSEEEITVKLDKSKKSVKGIENALIKDSVDILSMPENRIKLITPNGIDILKGIAEDMAFIDRGEAPGTTKSPTEIFELGRNLYKHQSNSIGKAVLGVIAVANTFNTLFARTGLIMDRNRVITNKLDGTPILGQQVLYLPHNEIGGRISLSSAYSADLSNRVADIINQMINGAVDVAKDAWIFDIQGNKEVIPSLLFMIQAGVPIDQAIYFVSQPIIKDFLAKQRLLKSKFAVPIGQEDVGLFHRLKARDQILFNTDNGFVESPKAFYNAVLGNRENPVYDKELIWNNILMKNAPNLENYSKEDLKKNLTVKKEEGKPYSDLDKAVFSQFVMIQEMASQITQLTQSLKFDNDKTSTLLDARMKLEQLDNLTNGISEESIRRISEESPISAFKIQDFILERYHGLFPLRDSEEVNEMVQNLFRKQPDGKNLSFSAKKATGMDDETLQRTLRNDIINFLFQRSYYNFNIDAKSYQGKDVEVEVEELRHLKAAVREKEGKLYVDKNRINELFITKQYAKQSAWQFAAPVDESIFNMYDSITGKKLFTKFLFERELLRSYPENSKENISKTKEYAEYAEKYKDVKDDYSTDKAYESVLRDKALDNLNLHGSMFYGDRAYGRRIMQLKETNPKLFETYPILANLEAVTKSYASTTLTNLKFSNTLYTSDDLNVYHNNLQNLANPSVIKSKDPVENQRISELFQKFGIYAMLQSGTDVRSTFSMIRAVPTEMYINLLEKPYKEFTEQMSVEEINDLLRNYQYTFINSQYAKTNFLSKKIKNWATNPFLEKYVKEMGEIPNNVIYNLDPEALQKSIEAAAAAEQALTDGVANSINVNGVAINLTELGIKFQPNEQQVEALNNIAKFISKGFDVSSKDVTDNMYTLMGYAGTGKTSITKILLEYLKKRNISNDITATTHKAKGVLAGAVNKETSTIHKVLALAPNIDPTRVDLKNLEMAKVNEGSFPTDVLIIDEASFIGPDLFKFIKARAEKEKQQVIFIGDPAQLKPPGKGNNDQSLEKENSPVFKEVKNRSELTQVERQAGDNPLGPILDAIRSNLKSEVPKFGFKSDIIGNQGIAFTDSGKEFTKSIVQAFSSDNFKQNRNFVRAVTYTNERVGMLNQAIRKGLGYTEEFVVGELMMGYDNFRKNKFGEYAINNSVDYVITELEYVPSKKIGEAALRAANINMTPLEMSGYNVTLQDISDPKAKPVKVFLVDKNNDIEQFEELARQGEALAAKAKNKESSFKYYYEFKESFASSVDIKSPDGRVILKKTLDYGYAHTIHKSQGSTYTNIFVDLDTIDISRDAEERNQMKYVALSRATNVAYVFTNKTQGVTPGIDWSSDFNMKTMLTPTSAYKTKEDIVTADKVSIFEDARTGVKTFRYNLDKDSGLPGSGILSEETATQLRQDYPNALFIFNNFTDLKGNIAGTNSVWRALGQNGMGIFTKVGPSPTKVNSDKMNMLEAMTDETLEDNKIIIDNAIKAIKEKLNEPGPKKYLVFDEFGFGQYMIGYVENAPLISRPTLKPVAKETFLHLSEQLYRNFGYINPHYLLSQQGRAVVQEGQPITDDEIIEKNKEC